MSEELGAWFPSMGAEEGPSDGCKEQEEVSGTVLFLIQVPVMWGYSFYEIPPSVHLGRVCLSVHGIHTHHESQGNSVLLPTLTGSRNMNASQAGWSLQ